MMDKLISQQAAIDKIKKRLYETALNNVGIKQSVDETLVGVAENRLENWFNELPSIQPDTTTHDSIPAETGENDDDRTSGDCISRQQAIDALKTDMASLDHIIKGMSAYDVRLDAYVSQRNQVDCDIDTISNLPSAQPERKTGRWIPDDSELGIKCNKCGKSFSDYVNAGTGYIFLEEIPNFCPNCGEDIRGEG